MNIIQKSASALICSAIAFTAIPMQVQAEADRTIPVYRLYNPNSGEHFYTVNGYERENLIINGWNDEGIGFYESGEGDDVYRVYNPNNEDQRRKKRLKQRVSDVQTHQFTNDLPTV